MAGRYLATELQNENGDVIYPHTEADIVFASDGTTVEENLGGEVTDADIQEIFGDSQVEAGKKLSVKEKIKKALKRYQTLLAMKVLDTVEEVEANTDAGYLMGAKAGAELINDLGGCSFETREDGAYVKYTLPGGADPVTKKLGSASGKLTIKYRYRLCVDYSYNSGASYSQTGEKDITGIITIVLSDGVITEYKNSGGIGNSYTVSQGNNWRGSVIGFAITFVQWEEIS